MQSSWSSCFNSNLTSPLKILDGDDVISGDSIAFRSKEFDMKLEMSLKWRPAGKRVNLDFKTNLMVSCSKISSISSAVKENVLNEVSN